MDNIIKKFLHSPILNSWFNAFVGLFSSIVAIPIVITKLSVEEINLWFLFASIIALSQGVQFGFNTTFTRFISYVYGGVKIEEFKHLRFKKTLQYDERMNKEEFSKVFSLMKYVYIFLSFIYVIILLLVGYFALLKPIAELSIQSDGWISAFIILFATTLKLSLGYYQNFMLGINKVALVQRITGVVNLFGLTLILAVLFFVPTLVWIIFIYQFVALVSLLVIIYFAKQELRHLNLSTKRSRFDKELFLIVWESAWKSGITTIIANVVKHISAILVAQWFPSNISASFLFTKRVFDILERFTMTTFQARVPLIARYRSQGDFIKLIPLLKQTQYISYGVYFIGYLFLLIFGESVLYFINSNVHLGSYILVILFSFATFLSRWGGMTLSISNQSNHVVEHTNAIIVSIIFFSIIFLYYKSFGVYVFPFAQLVALIVVTPLISRVVYKNIHTTFWEYESKVFLPFLGLLIIVNIIYYWSSI